MRRSRNSLIQKLKRCWGKPSTARFRGWHKGPPLFSGNNDHADFEGSVAMKNTSTLLFYHCVTEIPTLLPLRNRDTNSSTTASQRDTNSSTTASQRDTISSTTASQRYQLFYHCVTERYQLFYHWVTERYQLFYHCVTEIPTLLPLRHREIPTLLPLRHIEIPTLLPLRHRDTNSSTTASQRYQLFYHCVTERYQLWLLRLNNYIIFKLFFSIKREFSLFASNDKLDCFWPRLVVVISEMMFVDLLSSGGIRRHRYATAVKVGIVKEMH
jgi:hypothetical protein